MEGKHIGTQTETQIYLTGVLNVAPLDQWVNLTCSRTSMAGLKSLLLLQNRNVCSMGELFAFIFTSLQRICSINMFLKVHFTFTHIKQSIGDYADDCYSWWLNPLKQLYKSEGEKMNYLLFSSKVFKSFLFLCGYGQNYAGRSLSYHNPLCAS